MLINYLCPPRWTYARTYASTHALLPPRVKWEQLHARDHCLRGGGPRLLDRSRHTPVEGASSRTPPRWCMPRVDARVELVGGEACQPSVCHCQRSYVTAVGPSVGQAGEWSVGPLTLVGDAVRAFLVRVIPGTPGTARTPWQWEPRSGVNARSLSVRRTSR